MTVILNLAAAILLMSGMYAMGRKDGYDAAWDEIEQETDEGLERKPDEEEEP
ncbi:MAG: hypothetical protein LUG45_05365 [Clostridiales bacterium]|nr:hypothetical protein [Clostridiales bacterium]